MIREQCQNETNIRDNDRILDDRFSESHHLIVVCRTKQHTLTSDIALFDGTKQMHYDEDILDKTTNICYTLLWLPNIKKNKASLLSYTNALILMTLLGNHDVGFVEHKAFDLGRIDASIFDEPVEHLSRRSDHNLLLDLRSACHCKDIKRFRCKTRTIHIPISPRIAYRILIFGIN